MSLNADYVRRTGRLICNSSNPDDVLRVPFFCDADDDEYSIGTQVFLWTAFIFLISVAVVGNGVVMWIIYKHKVMHHGFNFFLFNMALADMFIAILNVGTSWTFNVYYDWWYGSLCPITTFFGIAPTTVSVFSMMALSWDRCQAVVKPLKKRPLSRRRSLHAITIIWIISTVTALPDAINARVNTYWFYNHGKDKAFERSICAPNEENYNIDLVHHILFVLQYALPLFVLSFTFARIFHAFRATDVAADNANSKGNHTKAKSKAVKMLALMVFTFMFCWLPYHLYHTFELSGYLSGDERVGKYFYLGIYWIAMSSTAYNPIIYCMANERFRIGFRFVFRWVPYIECRKEEYEYSQLFPERLRSMAISMHGKRHGNNDHSTTVFTYHSQPELIPIYQTGKDKRRPVAVL